jgi:nicotinate-nucleotide adenylyltransferase
MRIGVMGGTFDPIHHGHLVAASEVKARYNLDFVIFSPTKQPEEQYKNDLTEATPEARYLMCQIACSSNPDFFVSRADIDRDDEYTWTIDTLTELKSKYPNDELFFITGADAMNNFDRWRDREDLLKLAKFVAVTRPNYNYEKPSIDNAELLEIPALAISSTDIRNRVRENLPIWYLVPDGIVQYINKNNLYSS